MICRDPRFLLSYVRGVFEGWTDSRTSCQNLVKVLPLFVGAASHPHQKHLAPLTYTIELLLQTAVNCFCVLSAKIKEFVYIFLFFVEFIVFLKRLITSKNRIQNKV